nr:hypothetical protein [uncultured Roseateles sp.]
MKPKYRFILLGLVIGLLVLLAPVMWVETSCMGDRVDSEATYQPILAPEHRRPETNTYVTYPEWLIVHVYEDYAAVARSQGEAAFPYFSSINRYWSNLCVMTRHASARGEITGDSKAMLYTIGVSFSVEMAVKGAYERTIGWLTEAISGNAVTPEDQFARSVADDYAVFLVQTPWYAYPFGEKLQAFWTQVPWRGGNLVRKLERRLSFTLEFGVKALYSKAIQALAGMDPAPLRIRSVMRGLAPTHEKLDTSVKMIETLTGGLQIIETPRYREYTHILRRLALDGADIVEIAGNDEIFVTLLLPPDAPKLGGQLLITAPLAARPTWRRKGRLLKIEDLAALVRQLSSFGGELEHVYEY